MSTDRLIRSLTTAAVLLVAAIAAVVSFLHIEHLALTHGQEHAAAMLLPVSIDGTVAAASLVMLRAARAGLPTPPLARSMLVLSVTATLLANVAYGVPFGLTGALISGWPAVAFVGSVEMTIGMVRRTRLSAPARDTGADIKADTPGSSTVQVPTSGAHSAGQLNGHSDSHPSVPEPTSMPVPVTTAPTVLKVTRAKVTASKRTRGTPKTAAEAESVFAPLLALGTLPSLRKVKAECHVGDEGAGEILAHLRSVLEGGMAMASNGNGAHA